MMQKTWLFALLALVGSVLWSPNAASPELPSTETIQNLGKGDDRWRRHFRQTEPN